jgi:hypothetical protein
MSGRRIVILAALIMFLGGFTLAQDEDLPLANWGAPPYWTPPAAPPSEPAPGGGLVARTEGMQAEAQALPSSPLPFVAITPCRIVDTRVANPDGFHQPNFADDESRTFNLPLSSDCPGLPATAGAWSLNIQFRPIAQLSFLTAYPTGTTMPLASTMTASSANWVQNAAIVPAGTGGAIDIYCQYAGRVVIDINGYYGPQGVVTSLNAKIGDVILAEGANITVTPSGNTLTIASPDVITGVTAQNGLTGGGTSGDVTVEAAFAGSGAATTISRSDHDHWGQTWIGSDFGLTLKGSSIYSNATMLKGLAQENGNGAIGIVAHTGGDAWMVVPTGVAGLSYVPAGGFGNLTYGVFGQANGASSYGVGAYSDNIAISGWGTGVNGSGVYGEALESGGTGVKGVGAAYGVHGHSDAATGVYGDSPGNVGNGVVGQADGSAGYGVWGLSTNGYAGYFSGAVFVTGYLYKSGGGFIIDHPLDPANRYLNHSFVESPDMKDVYDGVIVLDANGEATVALPEWFETLNRDFRYQLTCVGGYAPVFVAEEIHNNTFKIGGGRPGLKVSWQVTGIRHDPWANDHRIAVEQPKAPEDIGSYLYPQGYNQPATLTPEHARMKRTEAAAASNAATKKSPPAPVKVVKRP